MPPRTATTTPPRPTSPLSAPTAPRGSGTRRTPRRSTSTRIRPSSPPRYRLVPVASASRTGLVEGAATTAGVVTWTAAGGATARRSRRLLGAVGWAGDPRPAALEAEPVQPHRPLTAGLVADGRAVP